MFQELNKEELAWKARIQSVTANLHERINK